MSQIDFNLNEGLDSTQVELKRQIVDEIYSDYAKFDRQYRGIGYIEAQSSLDRFVDLVKVIVEEDQKDNKHKIKLIDGYYGGSIFQDPEDSKEELAGVISYSLCRRAPGTMKGGNTPFNSGRLERVPHVRGFSKNEVDNPGEITVHMGQWFDNLLCFSIHARSNQEANKFAMWFEELMQKHRAFFAGNGFTRYHFEEREADGFAREGDTGVHIRPLKYYVRTEKNYDLTEQAINRLVVMLSNR